MFEEEKVENGDNAMMVNDDESSSMVIINNESVLELKFSDAQNIMSDEEYNQNCKNK